ncbi:MAG TPA: DinB family protein [Tepidisphaeraceae bacterium]|nr:DinB family protein [Tepidisphaeraceae bacterium]
MNGTEAIQAALGGTQFVLKWFLSDLSDADLLVRPVPGANHAAWQVGNVIAGDVFIVRSAVPDAAYPELPAGFAEAHGSEATAVDGPGNGFLTKDAYLKLFDEVRGATIAAVGKLSDADLDRPVEGNLAKFAPTLGRLFLLVSNHTLLHAGQFTVIRRKLGKPVLF